MDLIEKTKQEIVSIAQQAFNNKFLAGTTGNLSVYLRSEDLMLITPSSLRYETMTAQDIVAVKLDGTIISGIRKPSSELPMHAAVYELCPEVNAIVHTHSPYATSFAVVHQPIPFILVEMTSSLGGDVPCVPFAKPGSRELGVTAAEVLRTGRNGCLLSNHGVLTIGADLPQAYVRAEYVEEAAVICHHAMQIGTPVILPPKK